MADTLTMHKYGVLRVQPQAQERAPEKRYSHRNGETEPPTVAGWYWFDGKQKWTGGGNLKRPVMVEIDDEPGCIYWYGATNDADDACADGWLDGQWWGPMVLPWEDSNGK